MQETLESFDSNNVTSLLQEGGVSLQYIKEAVNIFSDSTKQYMESLHNVRDSHDPMDIRMANDQMMQLERVFNLPSGLPGNNSKILVIC